MNNKRNKCEGECYTGCTWITHSESNILWRFAYFIFSKKFIPYYLEKFFKCYFSFTLQDTFWYSFYSLEQSVFQTSWSPLNVYSEENFLTNCSRLLKHLKSFMAISQKSANCTLYHRSDEFIFNPLSGFIVLSNSP